MSQLRTLIVSSMAVALAAQVSGCGRSSPTAAKPQASTQAAGGQAVVDPDMVSAVSAANSATPISLKFRIERRPQVGQPVSIALALIPADGVDIDHIHTSFLVGEGLQLQSDRSFDVEQPTAGVPLEREVIVLPQRAGVLSVTATVVVDSDSGSISRSYSIPLIAAAASS